MNNNNGLAFADDMRMSEEEFRELTSFALTDWILAKIFARLDCTFFVSFLKLNDFSLFVCLYHFPF
jgi:hypothetical protein